jgi:hypothetical protein
MKRRVINVSSVDHWNSGVFMFSFRHGRTLRGLCLPQWLRDPSFMLVEYIKIVVLTR